MSGAKNCKTDNKLRSFFKNLVQKLDKTMQEKAGKQKSCCSSGKKGNSCCT